MIRRLTGPLLVAVVLAVASPVAATTLVAYDFTAIVSHASGAPADLEEGAIFSGRMIYDTDAASGGPVAGSGGSFSEAYTLSLPALPVMSLTFASGDTASSSSNGSADLVNFPDGSLFQDQVVIQSGGVTSPLLVTNIRFKAGRNNFPTGPLSSTALTTDLPVLDWGTVGVYRIELNTGYSSPNAFGQIYADVTSMELAAVPEPGTAALLGAGIASLAAVRRRRIG